MSACRFALAAAILLGPANAAAENDTPLIMRGQQILVAYSGTVHNGPPVIRSRDEARDRVDKALALLQEGKPFDEVVEAWSDEPDRRQRHGDLGLVLPGTLVPEVETALRALTPGQTSSAAVESVFGYHILHRLPLVAPVEVRHILIAYTGALRAAHGLKRTRTDALQLARKLQDDIRKGASFETVARTSSDDTATAASGGVMGPLRPGLAVPAFQKAAEKLAVGELSDPVETPFGFHLIQRTK
jgi:peptidyl-prolyl cis-trans isomerase SurA